MLISPDECNYQILKSAILFSSVFYDPLDKKSIDKHKKLIKTNYFD